jgi:lipoyl(octanoyl) transferase
VVRDLGRGVPYQEAWDLQRILHRSVVAGDVPNTVLVLEHDPVYTAGRRTERSERPLGGVEVIDVDRGGKITWHGPGQLVCYPILKLPDGDVPGGGGFSGLSVA